MCTFDQTDVVAQLVRSRPEGGVRVSAESVPACDVDIDAVPEARVAVHAHVYDREVWRVITLVSRSIHRQTKRIDGVCTDQIRTAQSVSLRQNVAAVNG